MKAKGVITDVLSWKRSRNFFYWRVNRKLAELSLRKKVRYIQTEDTLSCMRT